MKNIIYVSIFTIINSRIASSEEDLLEKRSFANTSNVDASFELFQEKEKIVYISCANVDKLIEETEKKRSVILS